MALNPLDQLKKLVSLLFRVCVASFESPGWTVTVVSEHDQWPNPSSGVGGSACHDMAQW